MCLSTWVYGLVSFVLLLNLLILGVDFIFSTSTYFADVMSDTIMFLFFNLVDRSIMQCSIALQRYIKFYNSGLQYSNFFLSQVNLY